MQKTPHNFKTVASTSLTPSASSVRRPCVARGQGPAPRDSAAVLEIPALTAHPQPRTAAHPPPAARGFRRPTPRPPGEPVLDPSRPPAGDHLCDNAAHLRDQPLRRRPPRPAPLPTRLCYFETPIAGPVSAAGRFRSPAQSLLPLRLLPRRLCCPPTPTAAAASTKRTLLLL